MTMASRLRPHGPASLGPRQRVPSELPAETRTARDVSEEGPHVGRLPAQPRTRRSELTSASGPRPRGWRPSPASAVGPVGGSRCPEWPSSPPVPPGFWPGCS